MAASEPLTRGILWLAALLLGAAGCSERDRQESAPASPALWQVESANGTVEGWLFGTIHSLPDGAVWRTARFNAALDASDLLVVEVADFEQAHRYAALARTPGVGLLSDRVSPEHREDLRNLLAREGLRDSSFYDIEDWAAAIALAQRGRDGDPQNGVDRALIDSLRQDPRARPIHQLEGMHRQLAIFDRLPAQEQQALLDGAVERYAASATGTAELRALWLAGDIAGLGARVVDQIDDTPLLYQTLLTDRNLAMGRKVAAMLAKRDKPFVALGAAHMVGETGLPALLEQEGYRVRRIQ